METKPHRNYLLPGPELEKLISDQSDKLRRTYPQIGRLRITLWVEETSGLREKTCEVTVHLADRELRVTKRGSTHFLAVLDAARTLKHRIPRIFSQNKQEL